MARTRSPALTDAEARIMAVLWENQNASVSDVVDALKKRHRVAYSTVQTMLRILETKGYVKHEKVARAFIYEPIIDERQARKSALRQLMGRLFNGSPSLLVLNVLDDERVAPDEIVRLKRLIAEA